MHKNCIYTGDAKKLVEELEDKSVDLVYFDPPFNSGKNYTLAPDSDLGFGDIFQNDAEYVALIEPVLKESKRFLKQNGSLFFHISASEMLIPQILCNKYFKNVQTIFWKRCRSKNNVKKKLGEVVDVIFWCYDSENKKFNLQYQELDEHYLENSYKNKDEVGYYALGHIVNDQTRKTMNPSRLYSVTINEKIYKPKNGWRMPEEELRSLISQNRIHIPEGKGNLYKKLYKHESKGKPATNLWDDIHSIAQGSLDKRFYPTQKPYMLIERIIKMTTDEGDLVLDPMCGSGTTGIVSKKLNRNFILFDQNPHSRKIFEDRLNNIKEETNDKIK